MAVKLGDIIFDKLRTLEGGGYRGLIVAFGDPQAIYRELSRVTIDDKPLLVYWPGRGIDAAKRLLKGWDFVFVGHLHDRLGEEHKLVVIDAYEGLQANTLAAAAEMVKAGGLLVITGWDWRSLSAPNSTGLFSRWLRKHILRSKNVLVYRSGTVEHESAWERGPSSWLEGVHDTGLPHWLERLLCCYDQVKVVNAVKELIESYEAGVVLVTGDRGRGKSSAVGLALAYLVWLRLVGDVVVIAPSPHSVYNLFEWLSRGLRAARIRFKAWGPGRLYHGVKGGWFRVRYIEPWRGEAAALTIVDEAAAVGPARVRRLAGRARSLVAITTVHGYEGSGRYWLRVLLSQLPSPRVVELSTPVRFAPGDPLEELLMKALGLRLRDPDELDVCKTIGV